MKKKLLKLNNKGYITLKIIILMSVALLVASFAIISILQPEPSNSKKDSLNMESNIPSKDTYTPEKAI